MLVVAAIADYLASAELAGRSESTLSYYEIKAKPLVRLLGQRTVDSLTLADVEGYVHARLSEVERTTIRKELGLLASALRRQHKKGALPSPPAAIIPDIGGAYVPRERALSRAEFRQLRAELADDRRDYLDTYCLTGVRESEMYRIRWSHVYRSQLHVQGEKTEGSDRWVPVDRHVVAVLRRRGASVADDAQLFPPWGNARRDLARACARAKIAPVSHNDLRRTYATWLAESGSPEAVTASLLGHTSSAMVRRVYQRIGRDAQRRAVRKLRPVAAPLDARECDVECDSSMTDQGHSADKRADRRKRRTPKKSLDS